LATLEVLLALPTGSGADIVVERNNVVRAAGLADLFSATGIKTAKDLAMVEEIHDFGAKRVVGKLEPITG
jgi:hypothetical protein